MDLAKKMLRFIWRAITIASVLLSGLGIHRAQSDLAMWWNTIKDVHPGILFLALLVVGLLLGEGVRSAATLAVSLGKSYSKWLRSEDIAWGVQVRGFIRFPEGYVPPDSKFDLNWKTASICEPWSDRIVRGADPVWLAVAFAGRGLILNRFRIRTPVQKYRMDEFRAQFSEHETRGWHSGHQTGDNFFKYRIPKTGEYMGPIPLDPVLKSGVTKICERSLGLPTQTVATQTVAFEIADIDCMRELLIVYSIDKSGIGVRFRNPGRLATIPDNEDRNRKVQEGEGILVHLSAKKRTAELGCLLPATVEDKSLQCLLAFRQAPPPNRNPRFVDELSLTAPGAARGSLIVY